VRARVRYAKTGKVRFVSAIDLGRVWERALRKADLPIAYSEGFSPHPKVSFPDALPLGYASTGEYAELTFACAIDLERAITALNAALPDGMHVLAGVVAPDGAAKLAKGLAASVWDVEFPQAAGLAEAAVAVTAADSLPVARQRKGDAVQVDLRPAVHQVSVREATVRVVLHHVEPPVRPTEVELALRDVFPFPPPRGLPAPTLVTRVAQGRPAGEGLYEALTGELVPPFEKVSSP
jgi:radical SAM-linked protein